MIKLPMTTRLFASALLAVGLSQTALAESNIQQNQPSTSSENTQASPQEAPWTLRQRLASAGFRDVSIVPSSLVITAIDRIGRPVLMRVTPRSMFFLIPAVSSPTTGAARADSNDGAAQQDQLSTTAEDTQAPSQNVPQSVTTGAATAGSNDNAQQNQPSSAENTQASARDVPQSIRERLTSAGFTDVNMVPGSSVITARDRSDRPVMMRITPRSIFFVTEIPAASASATGAASSTDFSQDK
jgi:hypothetical protein